MRPTFQVSCWTNDGYTRQRENGEYEPGQLDYDTGLPMEEAVRKKKRKMRRSDGGGQEGLVIAQCSTRAGDEAGMELMDRICSGLSSISSSVQP